jgi:hypothetical protein
MFQRNMLSSSSGAEVTKRGSRGVYIGLRAESQSEGGNMGTTTPSTTT